MQTAFSDINRGYNSVFKPNRLSLGLVVPIENYDSQPVPSMKHHLARAQQAEQLGFKVLWLRDVPFNVPSFGDAGQIFDPFVYLGFLAAQTRDIALGIASVVLPLRHPAHVAKAAASADVLSDGRLLLGIASGDRPEEYPALNRPYALRGEHFRESYNYIQQMWQHEAAFDNHFGSPSDGMDMLPKPSESKLPLLITGSSQQSPQWLAENGDGWMLYPRDISTQAHILETWRRNSIVAGQFAKPAMQPLYIDVCENPDAPMKPIHLGFRTGSKALLVYLKSLEEIGINHIALNLRFNCLDIDRTLNLLATEILPAFND